MNRSLSAPLPPIRPVSEERPERSADESRRPRESNREGEFPVSFETVGDLMSDFDSAMCSSELIKLEAVLHVHRVYLEQLYIVAGKSRRDFEDLVVTTSGLNDGRTANEIFSIATERFSAEDDNTGVGADCTMSRKQFATAIVRLANLCALFSEEGLAHVSLLSQQTDMFLVAARDA